MGRVFLAVRTFNWEVHRRKRRRHGEFCAYCGATKNLIDDHVPPKNLFPPPRPKLITVPACKKCNGSAAKDDENFRLRLCLSQHVGDHPAAQKNREIIFRSLENPRAPGLRKGFVGDIHEVKLRSNYGLWLGKAVAYDVDLRRIHRVVERTV